MIIIISLLNINSSSTVGGHLDVGASGALGRRQNSVESDSFMGMFSTGKIENVL
jgi:hypothetical protein